LHVINISDEAGTDQETNKWQSRSSICLWRKVALLSPCG